MLYETPIPTRSTSSASTTCGLPVRDQPRSPCSAASRQCLCANDIYAPMSTVESLDDGYFYNATNRYFGVYYRLPFGNPMSIRPSGGSSCISTPSTGACSTPTTGDAR